MFKMHVPSSMDENGLAELREYNKELDLFEEFELPVLLAEASEALDLNDFWFAVHWFNQYDDTGFKGWTPIEIARRLYWYSRTWDAVELAQFLYHQYRVLSDGTQRFLLEDLNGQYHDEYS